MEMSRQDDGFHRREANADGGGTIFVYSKLQKERSNRSAVRTASSVSIFCVPMDVSSSACHAPVRDRKWSVLKKQNRKTSEYPLKLEMILCASKFD
jgi:hypothetical protein